MAPSADIVLRPATPADRDAILVWRNDPQVRRYALDPREIDAPTHARWFARVLADPGRVLLIGERAGGPIGVVRYDIDGANAEISIYLVPGLAGHGLGSALIERAGAWLAEHAPQLERIRARVRPENAASLRAFEKAGFRRCGAAAFEYLIQRPGGSQ